MAPNITITKVDDSGGATLQSGDTIRYTITITNTGDMDALNAILSDAIDANTTLTDGTLDVTPIARNDSYTVDIGAEIMTGAGSGVLEGNDSDPDGGTLLVSAVQGSSSNVGNQATTNQGGTITMLANGGFNYIPPSGFSGTDTFEYTVTDDEGDTDTAIVSILVGQINDAPVALDDTASTDEDTAVMGNAIDGSNGGEDIDVDDDDLTVTGNTDPANGTVTISGDGNFTYTPNPDFNGSDSFTYTISDGNGGTDTATVNITVNAVNDAPVNTVPGTQVTDDATPLTLNTIQVSDVDADSGTVQSTLTVDFGTLTVAAGSGATVAGDGSDTVTITGTLAQINAALNGLEYDPSGTSGNATITLTTNDQGNTGSGGALSDTDAIAISVTSTVTPPDAEADAFSVTGNIGLDVDATGSILLNDIGGAADVVSFGDTVITATTVADGTNTITTSNGGTVLLNADGTFTYDPAAGFGGTDSFFYSLSNAGGSDTAEVSFTVTDPTIWFIDDSAGGSSDGTLANPFTSMADFNAANNGAGNNPAAGDDIFLAAGTYATGTTLLNSQTLIGQGTAGSLGSLLGITLPSFSNPLPTLGGTDPVINGDITLGANNTVSGLDVNGDITGSNVGSLTLSDVVLSNNGSNLAITNTTAGATLNILNNTLTPANPTDVNLTRFLIDNNANNAVVNITGNTIDRGTSSGDALRFENSGTGVTTTISNNDIDADTGTLPTGTGLEVLNFAGVLDVLVDNNTVDGTGTFHILIDSENNGTINATVTNNSVPSAIAPSAPNNPSLALNAEDNATLNVSVTGNDMQSANGGGTFENDIVFVEVGASATVNVVQTLGAISALNNGDSVGQLGNNINFGVPLPLMVTSSPTSSTQPLAAAALTDTDLAFIADAAIDRWVQTGLSTTQIETLESITFEVADLPDWYVGAATGTNIQIDTDAFGWGWFVDSTPLDDSEFSTVLSPTYTQADSSSPAHGQIDLLTTVMHEMGHVLGLPDLRGVGTQGELMNSTLAPSTRRTPTVGLADGVTSHSDEDTDYLTSPLDLGTLNEDQVVTVEFEVTVNDPLPAGITTVTNTATVTADGSINEMAAVSTAVECFLTGTLILTNEGEKAVETLKIGDLVQTSDGTLEPIKWIGRQTREPGQVCNPLRSHPIWVKAGALGNGLPHRDLYLSPDHALLVEGLLINAGALANGISIIKTEPTEMFTYYHIELDKHALLVAEGTAAESYLPQTEDRFAYDNAAEYDELYPHDCKIILWPLDYPRVSSYVKVPRYIRKHLKNIAVQLGLMEQSA